MKLPFALLLAGGCVLVATAAQAQTTFRLGAQGGFSLSSASFTVADYPDYFRTAGSYRSGFEAGVVGQLGVGSHLTVQPALLYARKAPGFGTYSYYQPNNYSYKQEYTLGLNYLTLPINLLFSQRAAGRGAQVFAGPYLGWLLGGTYRNTTGTAYATSVAGGTTISGAVRAGDTYATNPQDTNYYLRRLDAGVQAGIGYVFEALQVQASFSLGLRNIGAAYAPGVGNDYEAPVIKTRSVQLSAAYLFNLRN
jgi:hypothetical protein